MNYYLKKNQKEKKKRVQGSSVSVSMRISYFERLRLGITSYPGVPVHRYTIFQEYCLVEPARPRSSGYQDYSVFSKRS